MAHKLIHICDWCKSYVEAEEVVPIRITVEPPYPARAEHNLVTAARGRELCLECAQKLQDIFLLKEAETNQTLFADFVLPVVGDDLGRKIHEYVDPNDP